LYYNLIFLHNILNTIVVL